MILVPDIYIWLHYYRTRYLHNRVVRVLWWLPCAVMLTYTIALSTIRNFAPADSHGSTLTSAFSGYLWCQRPCSPSVRE